MSPQASQVLSALHQSGGRLHGRLDDAAPFMRSDPANPGRPVEVPLSIAEELFEAGLIQIDENAPIAEVYLFEVSHAGLEFLAALGSSEMSAG